MSLANPPANIPRTPGIKEACALGPGLACQQAVVESIDEARAAEEVGPLSLPSYYADLTVPEQLLVLADLERVDRGLPGFVGLSSGLDNLAFQAAGGDQDPIGPTNESWGSNWAGGEATALLADYDWMYDDGYGSPNMDCTTPRSGGCWDHRANILADYGASPSMGAGFTKVQGVTSMTELFSSGAAGHLDYLLPKQPAAVVTPSAVQIGTAPSVPNSAMLTVSAASGAFRALARIEGDNGHWSVTPSCMATAEAKCHLFVRFLPYQTGRATATVTVRVPGRIEQVDVSAYAGHGYWEADGDGRILAYGGGGYRGSAARVRLARPVVGMVATPDGGGYWEVAADGGVFSYGDARFFGSAARAHVSGRVVGMASSNAGTGYWLVTDDGSIYSFGSARFYGTPMGRAGKRVVGITSTSDGKGYWLVTSTGNIYCFGNAKDYGPNRPLSLHEPVVGMAATPDGKGYWMVTKAGDVYSFGDARYFGPATGRLSEVVGMAAAANGYYIASRRGEVLGFGGASGRGTTSSPHGSDVVAIAAV